VGEEDAIVAVALGVVPLVVLESNSGRHNPDGKKNHPERPFDARRLFQTAVCGGDSEHVDRHRVDDRDDRILAGRERKKAHDERQADPGMHRVVPHRARMEAHADVDPVAHLVVSTVEGPEDAQVSV
jgi:hypothetical protein